MREHIRKLIDEATRPGDPLDDPGDPALRLAAETIRLARLAASTHMILAARSIAEVRDDQPLATREHSA